MGRRSSFVAAIMLGMLAVVLSSCVTSPQSPATAVHRPLQPDYSYWPQDVSDLKPDPGVKYGVLPNGMRYAIMQNAQPAGAVSLKLRFASGSLQENDNQQGLAHFLEHMAFNGSKNVPEGEFVKLLQRRGLQFGAHTNASTSFDQTVYMLELPKNTPDLIDTGLMLFREVGGNLTLAPEAVQREKGVVLSEMRARDSPEYRSYITRLKTWYDGQRQPERMPIGKKEMIEGATREIVAEYYQRNYRPERALLVVTGDVDVASIEKLIAAKFGDWKGVGPDVPDPDMGTPKERGLVVASHIEPNISEDVTVTWFQPAGWEADTTAIRKQKFQWRIATSILNRRLERLARGANPPFVSASVDRGEDRGIANSFGIAVDCKPGTWKRAMSAAEQEVRRALEFGFSQAEVTRELKEWRAALEDAAGSASTRQTGALANRIVASFGGGSVFTHPSTNLQRFEANAATLTPATVLQGLKDVAQGSGPVIVLTSSQAVAGGDAAISAAWQESVKVPVAAIAQEGSKEFPYTSFGAEGKVASSQHIDDLDISMIQFANGVKLNFKKTAFEKDTINVTVRFAGGMVSLPKTKPGMYWMLPFSFTEGGLKKLTTDEMEEAIAGKVASVSLGLDDDAFEFDGRTRPQDLMLQMQLLAAFATDPAYRGNGLDRLKDSAESDIKSFSSSSSRVLSRETSGLVHSGDRRWMFPTYAQLKSISMADISGTIGPALGNAPIEISVVGDTTEAEVIKSVAATFGALPQRLAAAKEPAGARDVRFPKTGGHFEFAHEGAQDQATAYVAWAASDFYANRRQSRTLSLLKEMIEIRMTDEFREAQGATYSPSADTTFSTAFKGYGFLEAQAETKPELLDGFYKTLDKVVEEMRSGSFSDDVIDRARTPLVKTLEKSRLGNGFWQGILGDIQSDPRGVETVRTQIADYSGITRQELIAAARAFLVPAHRLEIRVLPRKQQALGQPRICPFTSIGTVDLQPKVVIPCRKAA